MTAINGTLADIMGTRLNRQARLQRRVNEGIASGRGNRTMAELEAAALTILTRAKATPPGSGV